MRLGQLVRDAREKQGMTQLELSRHLGYESMQFVSLFERGLSKIPLQTIGKLVVILDLPERQITKHLIKSYQDDLYFEIKAGKASIKN